MREHMHELHVGGAKVMAETAQQSKAKTADGRKTVGQAVAQIKNIAEQVNVSAKVVGTLGKRSPKTLIIQSKNCCAGVLRSSFLCISDLVVFIA